MMALAAQTSILSTVIVALVIIAIVAWITKEEEKWYIYRM